jgi:hypothetical protein
MELPETATVAPAVSLTGATEEVIVLPETAMTTEAMTFANFTP